MENKTERELCWKTGMRIGHRYSLEEYLGRDETFAVWEALDERLKIVVQLVVFEDETPSRVRQFAWGVQKKEKESRGPVLLNMGRVEDKYLLVLYSDNHFSLEEKWIQIEKENPNRIQQRESRSLSEEQKRRVLPMETILSGRYKVEEVVGIGGFGITYRCLDQVIMREVAIKEYLPDNLAARDGKYVTVLSTRYLEEFRNGYNRFLKEIVLTAGFIGLSHLPTVYDAFEENDTAYMVMRYEEGESLGIEFRQREYQPYSPASLGQKIMPVLQGLELMHQRGILHRDLSPGNMLQREDGEMVLIDMGSAMKINEKKASVVSVLKQDFAAPEQFDNARAGRIVTPEGPWTDVYSIGATMYYLLTGKKAANALRRGKRQEKLSFDIPGIKIRKGWRRLITECMEIEPEKRIKSVDDVLQRLEKLLKKQLLHHAMR